MAQIKVPKFPEAPTGKSGDPRLALRFFVQEDDFVKAGQILAVSDGDHPPSHVLHAPSDGVIKELAQPSTYSETKVIEIAEMSQEAFHRKKAEEIEVDNFYPDWSAARRHYIVLGNLMAAARALERVDKNYLSDAHGLVYELAGSESDARRIYELSESYSQLARLDGRFLMHVPKNVRSEFESRETSHESRWETGILRGYLALSDPRSAFDFLGKRGRRILGNHAMDAYNTDPYCVVEIAKKYGQDYEDRSTYFEPGWLEKLASAEHWDWIRSNKNLDNGLATKVEWSLRARGAYREAISFVDEWNREKGMQFLGAARARCLESSGRYDEALQYWLARPDDEPEVWAARSRLFLKTGRNEAALKLLTMSTEKHWVLAVAVHVIGLQPEIVSALRRVQQEAVQKLRPEMAWELFNAVGAEDLIRDLWGETGFWEYGAGLALKNGSVDLAISILKDKTKEYPSVSMYVRH